MESAAPESVQLLYERMQDAMTPVVQQHVVSIAAYYGGELRHHATGTLVRFSDHYFMITAAHAIEDCDKGREYYSDLPLLIDNGDSNHLVPLYGDYHATRTVRDPERSRLCLHKERHDLWDIGIWELHRQTVNALTTKRFLSRPSISITDDLTTGVYFLAGCPCSWAHADVVTQTATWNWLRYIAHPHPERNQLPNFDERFHVAICLGDDSRLPAKLGGISGCPIRKLADLPVKEDWSVDEARVVAVETCVWPNKPRAICGTKWRWVLPVLAAKYPEIREAFRLWLPGME